MINVEKLKTSAAIFESNREIAALKEETARLRAENAELLAACKQLADSFNHESVESLLIRFPSFIETIEDAEAKPTKKKMVERFDKTEGYYIAVETMQIDDASGLPVVATIKISGQSASKLLTALIDAGVKPIARKFIAHHEVLNTLREKGFDPMDAAQVLMDKYGLTFEETTDEIHKVIPHADEVRVKALEWKKVDDGHYTAQTPFGSYSIVTSGDDDDDDYGIHIMVRFSGKTETNFAGIGIDEAQSACQADFKKRVEEATGMRAPS